MAISHRMKQTLDEVRHSPDLEKSIGILIQGIADHIKVNRSDSGLMDEFATELLNNSGLIAESVMTNVVLDAHSEAAAKLFPIVVKDDNESEPIPAMLPPATIVHNKPSSLPPALPSSARKVSK